MSTSSTQSQLAEAVKRIDQQFGTGYAKDHPELVGSYLVAHAIREIDETLASTAQSLLDLSSKTGPFLKLLGIGK
jgi:hypothetical protein